MTEQHTDDVVETVSASRAARILIAAGLATFDNDDEVLGALVRSGDVVSLPPRNGQEFSLRYAGEGCWEFARRGRLQVADTDPGEGHSDSGFAANH